MIKKYLDFKINVLKAFQVKSNKFLEINFYKFPSRNYLAIFNVNFDINSKTDHAGIEISVVLLGIHLTLQYYDCRHWCNCCNKFVTEKCSNKKHANKKVIEKKLLY
jgi:hypothetical protein